MTFSDSASESMHCPFCHIAWVLHGSLRPSRFKGKGMTFHLLVREKQDDTVEEHDGQEVVLQASLEKTMYYGQQVLPPYLG